MISIGAHYKGPELRGSGLDRSIMAVAKALNELRGPLEKGKVPWVNAVFVVSGSLGKVDFNYLTYGHYSKKEMGVVVQIPVPLEISSRDTDLVPFVIDSLHGANAMAFAFFEEKGQEFPLREAENLVRSIARILRGE